MGQKVHPHGARVGVIKNWDARWFADKKSFSDNLIADYELRKLLKKKLFNAKISKIEIERTVGRITVNIFAANPGIIIGRGGQSIEATKKEISDFVNKGRENHLNVTLNIREVKNPDMDAQLVAESIAQQLEKRISFRRAMKMAMGRAMKSGAKGIKTKVGGRLGGAEIARTEGYHEGSIPLQTLRADIDYGFAEAHTVSGRLGIKVWIYKGQILPGPKKAPKKTEGTVN